MSKKNLKQFTNFINKAFVPMEGSNKLEIPINMFYYLIINELNTNVDIFMNYATTLSIIKEHHKEDKCPSIPEIFYGDLVDTYDESKFTLNSRMSTRILTTILCCQYVEEAISQLSTRFPHSMEEIYKETVSLEIKDETSPHYQFLLGICKSSTFLYRTCGAQLTRYYTQNTAEKLRDSALSHDFINRLLSGINVRDGYDRNSFILGVKKAAEQYSNLWKELKYN